MNSPNIYTDPSTLSRSDASPDFSARLLPLHDGRPGLRGTMPVEVREPSLSSSGGEGQGEGGTAVLDFVSSDETLDRYSEIIFASGWQLDSYHRNPVFQNAHQYGDVIFTLGRAIITEVRNGKLFQRIQFATDVNPMARVAHGLYRGHFLNGVSVGFIPLRWQNADGTEHQVGRSIPTAPHPLPSDGLRPLPARRPGELRPRVPRHLHQDRPHHQRYPIAHRVQRHNMQRPLSATKSRSIGTAVITAMS